MVQKLVSTQQLHSNIANKETSNETRSFDICSPGMDLLFVQCAGDNSSALDEGQDGICNVRQAPPNAGRRDTQLNVNLTDDAHTDVSQIR